MDRRRFSFSDPRAGKEHGRLRGDASLKGSPSISDKRLSVPPENRVSCPSVFLTASKPAEWPEIHEPGHLLTF